LIYENELIGLIALGRKKSGKFYRKEDINLLTVLANQGAVAIENALMIEEVIEKERMEEELSIARDLQISMLPAECPVVAGVDIAAASIPAREVGGDFYDFVQTEAGPVGIVIGDVTGKSVSGALVMAASRSILRMLAEEGLQVSEIMVRANRRAKKDIKKGMFVALLYAFVDPDQRTVQLCSAGQTQPVHFSAGEGRAQLVETAGDTFPLGILEKVDYRETGIALQEGDHLVFYTDGIVEAVNPTNEMFGFERFLALVEGSQAETAGELLQNILDGVREFVGSAEPHDDLTLIVLTAKGPDS
jgi:serine phosphatase RsbU (regulator of sigma subunit)